MSDEKAPDLPRNPANYQPLTPLSFLERAAQVFPDHTAIIHGATRYSYRDFYRRSKRLAAALRRRGVMPGDVVSVMLSNTPPMLEAHHGVPMAGAVLHALNTRLDPASIAFQLDHANTRIVLVDREFSETISDALEIAAVKPLVVDFDDPEYGIAPAYPKGPLIGSLEYESLLEEGDEDFQWHMPEDEWNSLSLNYTSGTTGNPKGVVYHHRGATLMAYANTIHTGMSQHDVYLWTLPMFHCNGWCFPWTLALQAATHVCLRWVRAGAIYDAIADHNVTHLCGAPIVMAVLIDAEMADRRSFSHRVTFSTAAAPPPEAILAKMADAGFTVTHLYGLTETYGPAVVNEWQDKWNKLDAASQAERKARQGVRYAALEELSIRDPQTMREVPQDGRTIGEVMMRGNIVMKGYLNNRQASDEAFAGGWFHSGDLGVVHPDGYIQIRDRSKDIIISGGENISSIEIEEALYRHPAVSGCGVVAQKDEKWGETPVAFVEVKTSCHVNEAEILAHCRSLLAHYKCPRRVVFGSIARTSTGKIQKFRLREAVLTLSREDGS